MEKHEAEDFINSLKEKLKKISFDENKLEGYLISYKWIIELLNIDLNDEKYKSQKINIREIDNSNLLNGDMVKSNIIDKVDYLLINSDIWTMLSEKFGGGPKVIVDVIYDDDFENYRAIINNFRIKVIFDGARDYITNRYRKISAFKQSVCNLLCIDYTRYHFRRFLNGKFYGPVEEEEQLKNTSISYGAYLYLLDNDIDARYPTLLSGVCGFYNLGNTCYFNAALQCLIHTEPLIHYFLNFFKEEDVSKSNKLGTRGALSRNFNEVIKAYSKNTGIAPNKIRSVLVSHFSSFSGYDQQDSQELLLYLLDGIHEDLNRIAYKPLVPNLDGDGTDDAELAERSMALFRSRNDSIIVDMFYGLLKSRIRCPSCEQVTVIFDPFANLSLPIPEQPNVSPDIHYVPYDPNEENILIRFSFDGNLSKSRIFQKIYEKINKRVHLQLAALSSDNTLSFTSFDRVYKLIVFEVPDEAYTGSDANRPIYAPCFLVLENNKMFNLSYSSSYKYLSHPVLMRLPSDISDSSLTVSALNRFKYLWASDPSETGEDINEELEISDFSGFPDKSSHLKVVPVKGMFERVTYDRASIGSQVFPVTNRNLLIVLNPEWLTKERNFSLKTPKINKYYEEIPCTKVTLHDCLSKFTQQTRLDEKNQWCCPKCKSFVCADKKVDIWSLPSTLIIHFKRFSQVYDGIIKSDVNIDYPNILDLTEFVSGPQKRQTLKYRLYAVDEHVGYLYDGHYTSHALFKDEWYLFDDLYVSKVPEKEVYNKNAYLLFYERLYE